MLELTFLSVYVIDYGLTYLATGKEHFWKMKRRWETLGSKRTQAVS